MNDANGQLRHSFSRQSALMQAQKERIDAELAFASYLAGRRPEKEKQAWEGLIRSAAESVQTAAVQGSLDDVRNAVARAEESLAPIAAAAKACTIYCVGHAHIDMNWMWSWPETVAAANDSFTTVLNLMDEFPDFRFSQSQASVYRIVEEHNPAMLERIRRRVREGRWEVTASHWVEGDKNIASGESLCRHLLYTRRYMKELFGLEAEDVPIDWAPDTFGHAATVPTYLSQGGVRYVYMHRPGIHTEPQPRPLVFWWEGPDGSKVLVHNDMHLGYNGTIQPDMVPRSLQHCMDKTGLDFSLFVYGVGDHGGGPTRRDLLRLQDMNTWPVFPTLRFATARSYFERLAASKADFPLVDRELNFEFTGCYTTQTLIKRSNRYAEKHLVDAETACALSARLVQHPYSAEAFRGAWRNALFNQFHDILPGSGVRDTRTYTHGLFQNIMAVTGTSEANALRALAARIAGPAFNPAAAPIGSAAASAAAPTAPAGSLPGSALQAGEAPPALPAGRATIGMGAGAGYASIEGGMSQYSPVGGDGHWGVLLFNPLPYERNEVVVCTLWDSGGDWDQRDPARVVYVASGPDGRPAAAQIIETGKYWGHQFVRLAFPASVPALGYAFWTIADQDRIEQTGAPQTGSQHAEAAPATPAVSAAAARQLGRKPECSYAPAERSMEGLENDLLRLEIDPATGGIRRFVDKRNGAVLIENAPPLLQYGLEQSHPMSAWSIGAEGPWNAPNLVGLRRVQDGPHLASLELKYRMLQSDFTLTLSLRAGSPALDIQSAGTWFERGLPDKGIPALRFSVPFAVEQPEVSYEIPFGSLARDFGGVEVPALRWAWVQGMTRGDRGARAGCLLLNDCKHGHSFDGKNLNLTLIRSSTDPDPLPEIGRHDIALALVPTLAGADAAEAIEHGRVFNHAIRTVNSPVGQGDLPARASLIECSPEGIVLDAVKQSEDGRGTILRLYECAGKETEASLALSPLLGEIVEVAETDLMEHPLPRSGARFSREAHGSTIKTTVPARGIRTLKVVFASESPLHPD